MGGAPCRHTLVTLVVVAILGLFVWTGQRGVDYGASFDEQVILEPAATQGVLPHRYNYPSVSHAIASATTLDATRADARRGFGARRYDRATGDTSILFRTRNAFMAIAALSILWLFIGVKRITRSATAGALASATLGLSWEIAYHSRWIAPDAVLMQFAALTLMCTAYAISTKRLHWWIAAAVAAGLGMGTKYPGGLLLMGVLTAAAVARPHRPRWKTFALIVACFSGAFILSTPGIIFDQARVLRDVRFEMAHYKDGHDGYSIEPGWAHLAALLRYLAESLFSRRAALATLFTAASMAGLGVALARRPRIALMIAIVPVMYIAYFSTQRVMIVRNYLLVAPFLAALVGLAGAALVRVYRRPRQPLWKRYGAAGIGIVLTVSLLANAVDLVHASTTIADYDPADQPLQIQSFSDTVDRYYLSPKAARLSRIHVKAVRQLEDPDVPVLFYFSDVRQRGRWQANTPGRYRSLDGSPLDANLTYYPSHKGLDRLVVATAEEAVRLGVTLRQPAEAQQQHRTDVRASPDATTP